MSRRTNDLLFDDLYREPLAPTQPPALPARATDGDGSQAAAIRHAAAAKRNRETVIDAVYRWPGRTSKELSELLAVVIDRHEIARRLPEAAAGGSIARHREEGRELTWWPADSAADTHEF